MKTFIHKCHQAEFEEVRKFSADSSDWQQSWEIQQASQETPTAQNPRNWPSYITDRKVGSVIRTAALSNSENWVF